MRGWMIGAAVVAAGMAGTSTAHATIAYVNYDSLVVSAGAGEVNNIAVVPLDTLSFLVTDARSRVRAQAGCRQLTPASARCAIDPADAPVASLSLSLGDGNDVALARGEFFSAQVSGGSGNDRLDLVAASVSGRFVGPFTTVDLGDGKDTLDLDAGSVFGSQVQAYGGTGADVMRIAGQPNWISGDDGDDQITAPDRNDFAFFQGGAGDDTIQAGGHVYGGDGADHLISGAGTGDYIYGEAGDDTIESAGDDSSDVVDCGADTDTAKVDSWDTITACETVEY